MFWFFFLLLFSLNSTNVSTNQLSVLLQANNEKYWMPYGAIYSFRNNENVSVECFLNCTECSATTVTHLSLYTNDVANIKRVTVNDGSAINISDTITLHKDSKEIYCEAGVYSKSSSNTLRSVVNLQYLSPNNRNNPREEQNLEPSLEPPRIRLSIYRDTDAIFAMFACTAFREGLALLSLYQIKGNDHILLKTVSSYNFTTARMYHLSLNKTLLESDHGTELFCAGRYFLEGPQLSNRIVSEIETLTFEKKVEALAAGERHSNSGLLAWLAVIGSVAVVALIIVVFLVAVIVKYRRKVIELERLEALRNRLPVPAPSPDILYEPVYSHGAGLKRPRVRPTEKRL